MADIEIDQIVDQEGLVRRLGSLLPQQGFVSSFNTFEAEHPVWEDDQILRAIKDPNRTPRRVLFLVYWILNQLSHGSCNGFAGGTEHSRRLDTFVGSSISSCCPVPSFTRRSTVVATTDPHWKTD